MVLDITVAGTPKPQGSHRAFVNPKTGFAQVTDDNPETKPWKAEVRQAASAALGGAMPLNGPVEIAISFVFARPKGHYGTGRNADVLKDWAPAYKDTKPDIDKLARAVLDALTEARVFKDDAQVAVLNVAKGYAIDPQKPGAHITVTPIIDGVTTAAYDDETQGALL